MKQVHTHLNKSIFPGCDNCDSHTYPSQCLLCSSIYCKDCLYRHVSKHRDDIKSHTIQFKSIMEQLKLQYRLLWRDNIYCRYLD